jgi:hypothetical protein
VLPRFGNQRGLDLLVEAGFSPVEAIYLGADLVVIAGNPAQNIEDVEKMQMVFKYGVKLRSAQVDSVGARFGRPAIALEFRPNLDASLLAAESRPRLTSFRNTSKGYLGTDAIYEA